MTQPIKYNACIALLPIIMLIVGMLFGYLSMQFEDNDTGSKILLIISLCAFVSIIPTSILSAIILSITRNKSIQVLSQSLAL